MCKLCTIGITESTLITYVAQGRIYGECVVIETLIKNKDEKITLPTLGTFTVKHVPERSGVAALAGGKAWTKPAHDELQFKVIKSVKEL